MDPEPDRPDAPGGGRARSLSGRWDAQSERQVMPWKPYPSQMSTPPRCRKTSR